jgi:D-amino-acid oxidase
MASVLVLGCGVVGLTTGITLLRSGHRVTIWARDLPPNTTSNQAAALWFPYLAEPRERVDPWAKYTLEFYKRELVPDPTSGVALLTVHDLYDRQVETPWWAAAVHGYRRLGASELPAGYADGFETESVGIDTSVHMGYLVAWFRKLGGEIVQKEINSLAEAAQASPIVVNCTGLGSRDLASDSSLHPVRGQTVKIRHNGFKLGILDDDGPNSLGYVIPRTHDIVLGGTAQADDWDLSIRASDREDILRKARSLAPGPGEFEIVSEGVGLRPKRYAVRLESERIEGATVIHNYGHGGAGFTLCWGCAEEIREQLSHI